MPHPRSARPPATTASVPAAARIDAVAVVVPAHDEAATIARCVRSVLHAIDNVGGGHVDGGGHTAGDPSFEAIVVVACDRCRDGTAARARRALRQRGVVLEGAWTTVGEVRSAATTVALARLALPPDRVWLANTDADSSVAAAWLSEQLRLARAGWAAVAGTVHLHDATPRLAQQFSAAYPTNADGTHHHVHGANLGVRADAYLAAGGWPGLGLAEDHALIDELRRRGEPVVSSTAVRVHTSARLTGRAENGFAATLCRLHAELPAGTPSPHGVCAPRVATAHHTDG